MEPKQPKQKAMLTIKTNRKPRFTIDACELSPKERTEFDYLDWGAIEEGRESALFVRFKGRLYDVGEFVRIDPLSDLYGLGWHGYSADSYSSGTLIRLSDDGYSAVMGRYYS